MAVAGRTLKLYPKTRRFRKIAYGMNMEFVHYFAGFS